MNSHTVFDELDQAIDQMMTEGEKPVVQDEIGELLKIASDLRHLPRPDFKMQLKAELEWQSWAPIASPASISSKDRAPIADADMLPTLSGNGYGLYPIRRANFAVSVLLHAAAMVAFLVLGVVIVQNRAKTNQEGPLVTLLTPTTYSVPAAQKKPGGGGGGGERNKLQTSAGGPPKTSMRQQLAPPTAVLPKDESKIMVEPTVVADLKLPDSEKVGDQISKLMQPSSGTGSGSGVGSGQGGGVGPGRGLGYGPGNGYGHGGGPGGNALIKPKLIYSPDPEFSEEARKAKFQGIVQMTVLVGVDGHVHDPHITRSLGMGLDEKALETVKQWKFEPAKASDGTPVAVYASIEVNFRLY
ncbi:MAG TPA: energy transducer TonB [Candidatus Angelobacter sp.]|jgi:TonB family protein|nr:energy transducer TonB [Candidatus Angelobacter sp.]